MSATTISLDGIDDSLQKQAEAIFQREGRTAAEVYRTLLQRTVEEQHTPRALFRPTAETLEAMRELETGGGRAYESADALMADLNADD
jgi:DNA-damage-inducible protein J